MSVLEAYLFKSSEVGLFECRFTFVHIRHYLTHEYSGFLQGVAFTFVVVFFFMEQFS